MGFFGKLFGGKPEPAAPQPPVAPPPPPPADTGIDPAMVRAFDAYGREIFFTRDQWRESILPANLRAQWNEPDALYGLILQSIEDGFAAEVVEAAERLQRIDPIPARGATIRGIVLMKCGRLDEAERVLKGHTLRHGEEGVILTNLAKVYAERNDEARVESTLWRALEVDPNLDNAVAWYEVRHRERGGEQAGQDALRRIAARPGSWRAQVWLARAALAAGDARTALGYYRESLSRAGRDVSPEALMQISGDLGLHGMIAELVAVTGPYFVPEKHGLQAGCNLIKAHLELGQIQPARRILEQLHALGQPAWKDALGYWEDEIGRAGLAPVVDDPGARFEITMLALDGPIWMPSPPADSGEPIVCFLGSSAEKPGPAGQAEHQLTDPAGRMSRALPLFLAERVQLACAARARTLVPWLVSGPGAFVLAGESWSDPDAASNARASQPPADYVVVSHVRALAEPWSVELRLVRTSDAACLGTLEAYFPSTDPGDAVRTLAHRLLALLAETARLQPAGPNGYAVPDVSLASYLTRLEQLLAIRAQGMENAHPGGLTNPREIVDGNIQLCLDNPRNAAARLLLAETVRRMNAIRPDVVRESAERVALLQREHPLSGEPGMEVATRLREAIPEAPDPG
jgi:tetratricopeptide (TPR) repeat protein